MVWILVSQKDLARTEATNVAKEHGVKKMIARWDIQMFAEFCRLTMIHVQTAQTQHQEQTEATIGVEAMFGQAMIVVTDQMLQIFACRTATAMAHGTPALAADKMLTHVPTGVQIFALADGLIMMNVFLLSIRTSVPEAGLMKMHVRLEKRLKMNARGGGAPVEIKKHQRRL